MKVTVKQQGELTEKEGDFFVIGQCLGLTVNNETFRIFLTPSQWHLLADTASQKVKE